MSRRFYEDLDWSLLLMFAGLPSSSWGARSTRYSPSTYRRRRPSSSRSDYCLSAVTAVLASNVSAMPILKPFVAALPGYGRAVAHDRDGGRRSPATSTVPGSIVNLIVEETGV